MYRIVVSFYGSLFHIHDRQYIADCDNMEEVLRHLQKEIRKEYGIKTDEYRITEMEYLPNTKII